MSPGVKDSTTAAAATLRKAISEVLSVRGTLLTVRMGDALWVVRAGDDPRAWKKTVNEKGDGITPWQHGRPPIDSLLREPEIFPRYRPSLIDYCRRELKLGEYRPPEEDWEMAADFADEAEEVQAQRLQGDDWYDEITHLPPRRKRTGPFPWACLPRPGERLIRRVAPEPDEIPFLADDAPARQWRRIPQNHDGRTLDPPLCLTDLSLYTLRATIRRVRLCDQLQQWAAAFPEGALAFLDRHGFKERRWHLLNLWLRVPEGRELWDDVPALAWLAASSWLYKEHPVQRPLRSLRSLVRKPRSHLLRWLDLPAGQGTIDLLRNINPALITPRFAHALCRVLRDEDKRRAWLNLPRKAGFRELSLLAYDLPLSFPILRAINLKSLAGGRRRHQPVLSLFLDCLRMIRVLEADATLRPELSRIRSPERLVAFHDDLVRETGEAFPEFDEADAPGDAWEAPTRRGPRLIAPMPPPVPPPTWMRPLDTSDALRGEGRELHHCIGSYESDIVRGDFYGYAVEHPDHGRATLGIRRSGSGWRMAELRGHCNETVSGHLTAEVRAWIEQTPPVNRPPYDPHANLAETGDGPDGIPLAAERGPFLQVEFACEDFPF